MFFYLVCVHTMLYLHYFRGSLQIKIHYRTNETNLSYRVFIMKTLENLNYAYFLNSFLILYLIPDLGLEL